LKGDVLFYKGSMDDESITSVLLPNDKLSIQSFADENSRCSVDVI
jgi:hypothetical protein